MTAAPPPSGADALVSFRAVPFVRTIASPAVLQHLIDRLGTLRPDMPRRWGTLTAPEMLCHLGDACQMVTRARPRATPLPALRRPLMKVAGLWLPMPWPHGQQTNPMHDPRAGGTRPGDFEADRTRVTRALTGIANAADGSLEPAHGIFGSMSTRDWQRWAYRHTDYHLRQFGA